MTLIEIFIAAAFVNNFVFYRFLGICPFLGVSKKTHSALGMGIAVTFVMVMASMATFFIHHFLLVPFGLPFLKYVAFILVISSLVQITEIYIRKKREKLYESFGIYLPLITSNCAILGLVLLNVLKDFNFIESTIYAIGAGFGFSIALIIMSGIRERLQLAEIPQSLRGVPIALIVAGLLALAFGGFSGML